MRYSKRVTRSLTSSFKPSQSLSRTIGNRGQTVPDCFEVSNDRRRSDDLAESKQRFWLMGRNSLSQWQFTGVHLVLLNVLDRVKNPNPEMQKATSRGGLGGRNGSRRAQSGAHVRRAATVNCYVKWSLTCCESAQALAVWRFCPRFPRPYRGFLVDVGTLLLD